MRIITPFDGSEASVINLKKACSALVDEQKIVPAAKHRLLITIMETLPNEFVLEQTYPAYEAQTEALLDCAIREAHSCGVQKVDGEIVRLHQSSLAAVLAERANSWQADVIYLPANNANEVPKKSISLFARLGNQLGFSKKLEREVRPPNIEMPLAKLNYLDLLELLDCVLIMTDSTKILEKLSYLKPRQAQAEKTSLLEVSTPSISLKEVVVRELTLN